jgi:hypothetical protein
MGQPYGQPPMGQPYGQPHFADPYGQTPFTEPYIQTPFTEPYGQPPMDQPYGQPPMDQPYGQPPMDQPYGQPPMDQHPMDQPPMEETPSESLYGQSTEPENSSKINIEKTFKGIIPYYEKNIIYVILNFNEITDIPKNTNWVNVYEVENISPDIKHFFTENPYLTTIHTAFLTKAPTPNVMYLSQITDSGEYQNIKLTDTSMLNRIIPRSYIKGKGNFFLFSKTPILSTTPEEELVKALVFINDSDSSVVLKDSAYSFGSAKFISPYLFNQFKYQNTEYLFIKQYDLFKVLTK